ncbi:MAG TPA: magnesium transporter [Burkholderiales bacterium]|nr:magnesium transporter [Burkholderiales bacterium]
MDAASPQVASEIGAQLAAEVKALSAEGAASRLATHGGAELVATFMRLPPAFTQEVLAALPDDARERAFAAAPAKVASQWQRNAFYEPDSIGRMMEPAVGVLPAQTSIAEAVAHLRELGKGTSVTYLYVVDAAERLVGVVTMRDLLMHPADLTLGDVMLTNVFVLHPATPLQDAMKQVLERHYPVYPVVDNDGRVVGLVRGQSLFEARAVEISLQAGSLVGVDKEERIDTPLWQALRMRHPWLQVNLFTAFGTAYVVSVFDGTIKQAVVLAAFLPVLSCLAGNNGCQALAITLRGLTLNDLARHPVRVLLAKEVRLGALNGLLTGVVGAVVMYLFASSGNEEHPILLALIMLAAMVVACVVSCLLGTLVPLAVRRIGADPATASGLFVLTITDIFGMAFMLMLATALVV